MNSRPSATPRQLDVLAAYVAAAYRHGLALALPDAVLARPTGAGHGGAIRYRVRIVGRVEELASLRSLNSA